MTPGYAGEQVARLDGLLFRPLELIAILQRDHPEASHRLIEMAVSLRAVALNERCGPEVLQAGARRLQRLTTAAIANGRVLEYYIL